jgi:hypothetical protein
MRGRQAKAITQPVGKAKARLDPLTNDLSIDCDGYFLRRNGCHSLTSQTAKKAAKQDAREMKARCSGHLRQILKNKVDCKHSLSLLDALRIKEATA